MTSCKEHNQKGDSRGYGMARIPCTKSKTTLHRRVYVEHNGVSWESIKGMVIRHTCDNPRCINPEHLVAGTPQDNMDDKVKRNRCPKPCAVLTAEQVEYIRANYKPKCRVNGATPMARKFGVTMNTVWRVAAGVTF